MKIDFDGVQAFVMIAELGGFSKAAQQLHITQTALTRRIQKLYFDIVSGAVPRYRHWLTPVYGNAARKTAAD